MPIPRYLQRTLKSQAAGPEARVGDQGFGLLSIVCRHVPFLGEDYTSTKAGMKNIVSRDSYPVGISLEINNQRFHEKLGIPAFFPKWEHMN